MSAATNQTAANRFAWLELAASVSQLATTSESDRIGSARLKSARLGSFGAAPGTCHSIDARLFTLDSPLRGSERISAQLNDPQPRDRLKDSDNQQDSSQDSKIRVRFGKLLNDGREKCDRLLASKRQLAIRSAQLFVWLALCLLLALLFCPL